MLVFFSDIYPGVELLSHVVVLFLELLLLQTKIEFWSFRNEQDTHGHWCPREGDPVHQWCGRYRASISNLPLLPEQRCFHMHSQVSTPLFTSFTPSSPQHLCDKITFILEGLAQSLLLLKASPSCSQNYSLLPLCSHNALPLTFRLYQG